MLDGNGGAVAAMQSYSLAPVNDGPTAAADAVLASEDQPLVLSP